MTRTETAKRRARPVAALFVSAWLSGLLAGCTPSDSLSQFEDTLNQSRYQVDSSLQQRFLRLYQQQPEQSLNWLLEWGLDRVRPLAALVEVDSGTLPGDLAQLAVNQGRSFVLLERLSSARLEDSRLFSSLVITESRDQRTLSLDAEEQGLADRLVLLSGKDQSLSWTGAAFVVAENTCQVALASAAHNVLDASGQLRIPLADFKLSFNMQPLTLVSYQAQAKPHDPSRDWVLLEADKPYCGRVKLADPIALADTSRLPGDGAEVEMLCFHQGPFDSRSRLYTEACHLNPVGKNVLDYYDDRTGQPLAIHGCQSDPGSSGCPILWQQQDRLTLLGSQIEGDSQTGAGIALLLEGDFRSAIEDVQRRYALPDSSD